jgi:hypothetical protein
MVYLKFVSVFRRKPLFRLQQNIFLLCKARRGDYRIILILTGRSNVHVSLDKYRMLYIYAVH